MKIPDFKKIPFLNLCFFSSVALMLLLQSCIKDNFEFDKLAKSEWSPNLAVPLVYSSLTVQDILTKEDKNGIISVGSDNFCTLIYKGNLFSLVADELIKIPDQTPPVYNATITPAQAAALSISGATVTLPYSQTVNFVSGTTAPTPNIDSIVFKDGSIDITLNSDIKVSGQISITIPAAKKNGAVFSKTMNLNYSGSVPVVSTASFPLAGYKFDMTNGGTTFNQFVVNFVATLKGNGTPVLSTNKITLSETLDSMKFDRVFGDIGQQSLSPNEDTVAIAIFKNSIGTGSFTLVDPKVKVTISNSYGVPISATIGKLDGYNPGVNTYPITGSPNPLPISSPTMSQIGQSISNSFTLDKNNSNIVTVVNNTPKYLIYKVNSQSNPAGGATHSNFVLDSSKFKVDMEINLPLWGSASDFVLIDTVPFKISENVSEEVESALLRTYNSNGFPLDIGMQVYFIDSLYTKLDSLVIPNQLILKSAIVNTSTGIVTAPSEKVFDVTLTKARLQDIKATKYMLIKAVANTATSTNVKIYSNYKLDVKMGLKVQLRKKI